MEQVQERDAFTHLLDLLLSVSREDIQQLEARHKETMLLNPKRRGGPKRKPSELSSLDPCDTVTPLQIAQNA